ncbi:patatin-like phospholipase family protein [Corallococcus sp. M34]|uniref:patatin-like phospholipase family protein n=1 Tax=Citreicoccus inhibens TaxID=2849499 RepID=UPI001C236C10|nr:patatin-like phospholipase family protein [Citreicoccus inhibens]MBU8898696.1 patatin-like phospholipase family protein [Citreicoccus inhibens]
MRQFRGITLGVWLLACVALAAESSPPARGDIALTISGGVSLGAYEAGLTWASVRFLRLLQSPASGAPAIQPHLAGVTGASAGSINALLAAALWCQAPDSTADDSVDSNLMRDTWLPVGLDDLLPEDARRYRADDGLLTRAALERVLADVRAKVFQPQGLRRFRPGCVVPLGFSVTRLSPEVRNIAGLPSVTQRFVVPLLFEVTPTGRVRLRYQPLPEGSDLAASALSLGESPDPEAPGTAVSPAQVSQALMSSAAFPLAFSPRELCDCAAACPVSQQVRRGTCPGPVAGESLTELTCAARSTPGHEVTLCRRPYVDGGVFDNAPVGLAIELAESTRTARPWWPVTYVFVDPDVRRLQGGLGAGPAQEPTSDASLAGSLDLFAGLVTTARNSELGRAARAMQWNRTSRDLLLRAAYESRQYARLHGVLSDLAHEKLEAVRMLDAPDPRPRLTVDARLYRGRLLFSCVSRLRGAMSGPAGEALLRDCARALRGESGVDPLRADAAQVARVGTRLSMDELVELGTALAAMFSEGNAFRRQVDAPLTASWMPGVDRLRIQDVVRDGVELSASTLEFFAGELESMVRGGLTELQQVRLRGSMLEVMRLCRGLSFATNLLANAVLDSQLQGMESMPLSSVAMPAHDAREALRSKPPGVLFAPEAPSRVVEAGLALLVDEEVAALQREPEGGTAHDADPALLAHRTRLLGTLVGLVPALQLRAASLESLAEQAQALQGGRSPERRLFVSTRFAPLASSQLGNFAGFLDRPLRELDYYSGIYDAVHSFAVEACARQDPYARGSPIPVRRPPPSDELDLAAPDTQRCVGQGMHVLAERMGLLASPRGRHVLVTLAREELAATLGSRAQADALLGESWWAWASGDVSLPHGDSVAAALAAARSHRRACGERDTEALCLEDPGFDAFLAGLRAQGFQAQDPSMKLALEDPARWWGTTLRRVVDRATVVELQETNNAPDAPPSTARDGVRWVLAAGQLWTRRSALNGPTPRFELDPSSVPRTAPPGASPWKPWALHLLPYRVAFDAANGGVAAAWLEPALRLSPSLSLVSQVEPIDFESEHNRLSSTVGLRPTVHINGVSLGLGPRASVHWAGSERRFDWGFAAHAAILQDRLGVSVGVRESPFQDGGALRGLTVSLSLADLNGLAYWFTL